VNLNWLDFLLLAVLAYSTFRSFRKGFSREIVGLAAALFGLIFAMWFYGLAASYISPYTGLGATADLLGFIFVFAAVLICGSMLGYIVNGMLRTVGLSFFDQMLGGAFGLIRGVLLAVAVLTAYLAFGPTTGTRGEPEAVLNSRIAPWVMSASQAFVAIAPMELKLSFRRHYGEIQAALNRPKESRNK
jgi:membrane protein required for colicin V production